MSKHGEVVIAEMTGMALSTEVTVPELIRFAIERKVDPDVLEKLVALQERVMARNARAAFFEALHAFQEECPEIHKSRSAKITTKGGGEYGYTFAPLEEVTRTIRPLLKQHGLAYSWTTEASANPGILNVVCVLRHVEGHEERATFPVPSETSAAMSAAQKNGAALTYGRRQSLVAVLGLVTSDDTDGQEPGEPITAEQVIELDGMIQKSGANRARFLKWLEVERLSDLPLAEYGKAVRALQEKTKGT
jgi:hypothetical protein